MASQDVVEQTLFICSAVRLYRIPPRPAAGGYRSGEWRVADEIFHGRLRFVAFGTEAEIRFEDTSTGELFALVPVRLGQRHIAVEPAVDSSRNFVVRVENTETNDHAFLGMGFEARDVAFDFSAALEDNERRTTRERSTGAGAASSSEMSPEVAALHKPIADFRLKEGQTIHVDIKNKVSAPKKSTAPPLGSVKILAPPPPPAETKTPPGTQEWATFD